MPIALTTLAVVVFIGPGIAFFIGLHTSERHARDGAQSRLLVDLALSTFMAVIVHSVFLLGFGAEQLLLPEWLDVVPLVDRLVNYNPGKIQIEDIFLIFTYTAGSGAVGWYLGYAFSVYIVRGTLRFAATHKWVYDLPKYSQRGYLISAFVLTNTVEDKKVLMYSGYLQEIFLTSEGQISNLVMSECYRYYMNFDDASPVTGSKTPLFASQERAWNYFVIAGPTITNVLFTLIPLMELTTQSLQALTDAIANSAPDAQVSA